MQKYIIGKFYNVQGTAFKSEIKDEIVIFLGLDFMNSFYKILDSSGKIKLLSARYFRLVNPNNLVKTKIVIA